MKKLIGLSAITGLCTLPAPATAQPVEANAGAFVAESLAGCRTDLVYLNQLFGWQASWPREWQGLASASDEEIKAALILWKTAPAALAATQAALARTTPGNGAAPRVVVERTLAQIDDLANKLAGGAPPLRSGADPALASAWNRLFADEILPAIRTYAAFLHSSYLPVASDAAGLAGTPGGASCFRNAVSRFTSVDLPAEEIERIGWRLLGESERDLAKLNHVPLARVPALLASLRARHEEGFSEAKLILISTAAIARASAAMPRMFSRPVRQAVVVQPLPRAMEASFPAGYYDDAEPGAPASYVINLSRPNDRRLMAEVIAFHETLPGHHTRGALGYPPGEFNSGFAEGWALYSEFLADEMHLYSGKLDRSGMMAKHLWAASRLVVEPGLHLHGWTRAQAVDFMRTHTALSDAEIGLEVDRYIATPGQSLSYMLGYDRISSARRYAEKKLGKAFDLRAFHEIVLAPGSRPLDRVYADVVRWADSRAHS